MPEKLVGQNYTTPDLVAKVTGRAKYAEDYRADGMLFAKLLLSPMPHCRERSVDARAALALPGVKAILRADDLPDLRGAERALTNEPLYQGEPILALAAVDEATAAEAIERIAIDLEPLPFVVDPVESLRPTGANARLEGNVWVTPPPAPGGSGRAGGGPSTSSGRAGGAGAAPQNRPKIETLKWTDADFAAASDGALPTGRVPDEWSYGDLDAGFKSAAVIVDETFVVQSTGHQPMETRSAMAYWHSHRRSARELARDRRVEHRAHLRVLRRRLRQQGRRRRVDGDSRDAVQEDRHAGDDARHARRGAVLRPRADRHGGPCARRFQHGWPHHCARSLHRGGQRPVRPDGRLPIRRQRRVAHLAAGGHAVARRRGPDQHAAEVAAAVAGRDAGQCDHGARRHESGKKARPRPGRHPPHQLAGREGALRRAASQRTARARHVCQRQAGARSRRGPLQVGGAQGAIGQAAGIESARHRRGRRPARRGIDRLRRADDDST